MPRGHDHLSEFAEEKLTARLHLVQFWCAVGEGHAELVENDPQFHRVRLRWPVFLVRSVKGNSSGRSEDISHGELPWSA